MTVQVPISDILLKHFHASLTAAEQQALTHWLSDSPHNRAFYAEINDEQRLRELILAFHMQEQEQSQQRVKKRLEQQLFLAPLHQPRIDFVRKWGWVAASIILLLGIGSYLWTVDKEGKDARAEDFTMQDILPGREGAILTLSTGVQLALDSMNTGVIAQEAGTQVLLRNGQVSYNKSSASNKFEKATSNTLTTPLGRQYQVKLPDGSKVWLNAGSSLRYPIQFPDNERFVEVTGEAYFEIAKLSNAPFRVKVNDKMTILVLGTSFNINAYGDENSVTTTLLDGSIRVQSLKETAILRPGEQAIIALNDEVIKIESSIDAKKVMAWKNGVFNFNRTSIATVMLELARWYDVEIEYDKNIPHGAIIGEMQRNLTLHQVLESLNEMGVKCQLNGRRIKVYQ